ncbi:MAG: hypothetical protein Q7J82_08585 [Coriobacteriia bacterium]|nr:hypothetical protein [Coriobacteriia bacterium]
MYTSKDTIRVMIITKDHRIEGDMYILEGSRLTDALNSKGKDFYAITEAKIWHVTDDTLLASPSYVAIARDSITAIFPVEP